jgi:hypothetical protein
MGSESLDSHERVPLSFGGFDHFVVDPLQRRGGELIGQGEQAGNLVVQMLCQCRGESIKETAQRVRGETRGRRGGSVGD